MAIHPGDILAGYRVTRLLGRGGMGEVWAAVDDDPADPSHDGPAEVAIKILLARAAMKPDLVRRFEREARIASAIKSPYVCQLIEVAMGPDGAHLLVFEHLSGESLADRLKREQYLPFSEVGPIIDDVLRGLAAAHDAGVIHRDLKPGNIFLVESRRGSQATLPGDEADLGEAPAALPDGADGSGFGGAPAFDPRRCERAKILDFGISKLRRKQGHREPTLTAFDATLGSFAYMAPEQVRGAARADERADIYAVGAVAFRSLSGRLPFEGATAAVLVAMKLDRTAPSLAEATGEQWPAGIERFLERALERDRDRRFATATEALEVWRSIQPSAIQRSAPVQGNARPPSIPGVAPIARPAPAPIDAVPRPANVAARTVPAVGAAPPHPPLKAPSMGAAPPPPPLKAPSTGAAPPSPPLKAPSMGAPPSKTPSGIIPAPTKPVVTVYAPRPTPPALEAPLAGGPPGLPLTRGDDRDRPAPGPGSVRERLPSSPPPIPAPRPPMQSYQVVEDNPTEVDGPPTMTFDGSFMPVFTASPPLPPPREPPETSTKRRTGRR